MAKQSNPRKKRNIRVVVFTDRVPDRRFEKEATFYGFKITKRTKTFIEAALSIEGLEDLDTVCDFLKSIHNEPFHIGALVLP